MTLWSLLVFTVAFRCSRSELFCKKGVHENVVKFTGKHLRQSLPFNKVAGLVLSIKEETLAQVFSCKFCKIFKNTFFLRTPPVAASWLRIYLILEFLSCNAPAFNACKYTNYFKYLLNPKCYLLVSQFGLKRISQWLFGFFL